MNITKSRLTDEQCDEFRRYPGSFNAMVRHVYEQGRQSGSAEAARQERERCAVLLESNANQCGEESITRLILETNAAAIRAME